jgi:uncharacterized protein
LKAQKQYPCEIEISKKAQKLYQQAMDAQKKGDADYLTDETCNNCFFFPICNGGCPEKRIRNKHSNAQFDMCILQKDDMENMLDIHYEVKQKINSINKKL